MWLEMSRDEAHGGGSWAFSRCLWAPTKKRNAGSWRYWQLLDSVRAGDLVLHLRGKDKRAAFVGYSNASADGYETTDRPPILGQWSFAETFLRVPLRDFVPFAEPIVLHSVFAERDAYLRDYYYRNKQLSRRRKNPIFFVVQGGKLQCLNGAYVSELTTELFEAMFGVSLSQQNVQSSIAAVTSRTREQLRFLKVRIGQDSFSTEVRKNFGGRCCFPGCSIAEADLLVGSHIARWSDVAELRGETSNGLCLCLLHDKAFELGWFTLDDEFRVVANEQKVATNEWALQHIAPFKGEKISAARIMPGFASMKAHWERTGFSKLR